MRFKKLKVFIAIALVAFILVIANIFVFGLFLKPQQNFSNYPIQKVVVPDTTTNKNNLETNTTTSQPQEQPAPQPVEIMPPPPVIVNRHMNTGAS